MEINSCIQAQARQKEYLVSTADMVVRPALLLKYANKDFAGLREMVSKSIKYFGLLLALPVGFLCGFSRDILSVWLGPEYNYLFPLLIILSAHQSLSLAVRPLLRVQEAYNKVRVPGIVTLVSGLISFVFAILMARYANLGAIGVAVAIAVTWMLRNVIFLPVYTAHIMKLKWWVFFSNFPIILFTTGLATLLSIFVASLLKPENWFVLGGAGIITAVIYLPFVWFLGLQKNDRNFLLDMLPWRK